MRIGVVLHYLGLLLGLVGLFMLAPVGVSLLDQEQDLLALSISAGLTCGAGGLTWLMTRNHPGPIRRKESFLLVAVGWALVSVFGALPYVLSGTLPGFLDAFFETMSGFTTTGSSVIADIEAQPHGVLFWRDLTQWLGGMGIIALFVALVPLTRIGASGISSLVEDEAPAPQVDKVTPRIRDTAQALWVIYTFITLAQIALLLLAGMPLYDAVTNAFGTMATGGFSPRNASIAHYGSAAIDWIIVAFMAIAGTNFALYYALWRGKVQRMLRDTEFQVYVAVLAGSSLLIAGELMLRGYYTSFADAIRYSAFQVVSQQTTTGFFTADFDTWPWFSKSLILTVMFVGASAGSTGGALKVIRLIVVVKYAHRQMYNVFQPRVVVPLKLGGRVLSDQIIRECVAFFIVYQSIFFFSTLALVAMDIDFVTALSGVAATLGNVGPGLAKIGPTMNYSTMPDLAKAIFTFDMYVGRLELWTVLILLRPSFWRER